ncbi:MAG: FAD-binding oxidoreductase [Rhodospirillales bacterium]|jgi:D-arginine dehydrogenase|nr:FAD-binding oxidoreductase [Rhodospirillales bacterium]
MDCDFLIIGAGMAGASAAYELTGPEGAPGAKVVVVEREDFPGYHTTGRSAAIYTSCYGHPLIRALSAASRPFFDAPPAGFSEHPLLTPRGILFVGRTDQESAVENLYAECRGLAPGLRLIDGAEAEGLVSVLAPGYTGSAMFEPEAMDMDVDAILQGYLRGFKARGGTVVTDAEVQGLDRRPGGGWRVQTRVGEFTAATVINAAGAWADEVARLAGLAPLGLVAKRRTAVVFDPPAGVDCGSWPAVIDVDERFYFAPDAGRILASPADETPMPPSDVQPEDIDVAVAIDRVERATTLKVASIGRKWAGLRSFFPDKVPAVGPDAAEDSFFWLAGQGGYGIMTAAAMGRSAAALAAGHDLPDDLRDLGLKRQDLAPARLSRSFE